jgi:hypothetical protein
LLLVVVRMCVCCLWRSKVADEVQRQENKQHDEEHGGCNPAGEMCILKQTVSFVFGDGAVLTVREAFVQMLALKHQAAPSEYQILNGLMEIKDGECGAEVGVFQAPSAISAESVREGSELSECETRDLQRIGEAAPFTGSFKSDCTSQGVWIVECGGGQKKGDTSGGVELGRDIYSSKCACPQVLTADPAHDPRHDSCSSGTDTNAKTCVPELLTDVLLLFRLPQGTGAGALVGNCSKEEVSRQRPKNILVCPLGGEVSPQLAVTSVQHWNYHGLLLPSLARLFVEGSTAKVGGEQRAGKKKGNSDKKRKGNGDKKLKGNGVKKKKEKKEKNEKKKRRKEKEGEKQKKKTGKEGTAGGKGKRTGKKEDNKAGKKLKRQAEELRSEAKKQKKGGQQCT